MSQPLNRKTLSFSAGPPQVDQTWGHVSNILGPVGIWPPNPEPSAAAFSCVCECVSVWVCECVSVWVCECVSEWVSVSEWCFFYGLLQGLSVDPQIFEQPDGGCFTPLQPDSSHVARPQMPSLHTAHCSSRSLHQHRPVSYRLVSGWWWQYVIGLSAAVPRPWWCPK